MIKFFHGDHICDFTELFTRYLTMWWYNIKYTMNHDKLKTVESIINVNFKSINSFQDLGKNVNDTGYLYYYTARLIVIFFKILS